MFCVTLVCIQGDDTLFGQLGVLVQQKLCDFLRGHKCDKSPTLHEGTTH